MPRSDLSETAARARLSRRALLLGAAVTPLLSLRPAIAADGLASRLILLGTAGGPSPKPNRSAPAQAIVVGDNVYIVDCGDGVARQMVLAGLDPADLTAIFLTHHHSDHNADFGNLLLLAWADDLASPVECFGPPPLEAMRQQFLDLNAYDIATRIADEGRPPLADLINAHEFSEPGLIFEDDNVRVTSALVDHPPVSPAFAYRFDCPDRSIVFSGDTAPSDALIALAEGADILVHEVMYLPAIEGLIADAHDPASLRDHLLASHTTTEQAAQIATSAGVETLVLSHFVPGGYPFIEDDVWEAAVRAGFTGEIIVGRDLMVI
ncbi:MBL fold metallo-hydrolase [Parasphingopyxis lamellibrachiae]|uniref:Ribonuclease BN (tRNA processing enzyme) n=1 Tax=Parasphingopyxis lamellibrachiae TaxID=680125 RepID=A0A3D9FBZ5_9SPHN|nr:MBL fold metallo-hydrolase [Parasphingopyxis lamellibrachiae]RED15067.1 ribonuclease BN (tRNA processing enzyme) [Parasphingopyxis lamellibrachiae]